MKSELSLIKFYFPGIEKIISNKQELVDFILKEMNASGDLNHSGYVNEGAFRSVMYDYLGDVDNLGYTPLSEDEENSIHSVIERTIEKCGAVLPIPTKIYAFVFPWSPTEKYAIFNGVMGIAPYSSVFHLFLSPKEWSSGAVSNTVAHELNHTIYYSHHFNSFNNYTVLDQLIIEGLAENFREQTVDPKPSSWSLALNEDEAFSLLDSIKNKLDSKDEKFVQELLFGSDAYERWAGYSVGYWLIRRYIKENKELSWDEIMRKNSHEILNSVIKI